MCFLSERIGGKVVNRWTQGCIRRRCSSTACRRREPEETHDASWINTTLFFSFHCNDKLSIIKPFCASHWEFVRLLFQIWTGSCSRDQDDAWRRPSGLKFIDDHCMMTWWWYICHHHCHHRRHQCQCDYLVGTESLAEQVDGRHLFQDFGLFPDWCHVFRTMSIKMVWTEVIVNVVFIGDDFAIMTYICT